MITRAINARKSTHVTNNVREEADERELLTKLGVQPRVGTLLKGPDEGQRNRSSIVADDVRCPQVNEHIAEQTDVLLVDRNTIFDHAVDLCDGLRGLAGPFLHKVIKSEMDP